MTQTEEKPWYKEGLSFKCTECGKCCTGSPGYVWINESEIDSMAAALEMTPEAFASKYLRRVHGRLSLIESKTTYDCVFLKDKKCGLYKSRPTQCRTFPWWPENLKSKESWEETAKDCEGIADNAPIVPFETIEEQRLIQLRRNRSGFDT